MSRWHQLRPHLKESLQLLGLMLGPARNRSVAVYNLLADRHNLGEQTRFINMGYWAEASHYDQACRDLALKLGQLAELGPHDQVLDVGCGFGEQDMLWMQHFAPREITAISITPLQIAAARRQQRHPRLHFLVADATHLPFADASFDKVLALESAFHFQTREGFFAEARRVLRPGGLLVLADSLPYQTPKGLLAKARVWAMGGMWQVPLANQYSPADYQTRLQSAGFELLDWQDISEQVWLPFKRFAQQRVNDPEIRQRVNPLLRRIWSTEHKALSELAYVLVKARRR